MGDTKSHEEVYKLAVRPLLSSVLPRGNNDAIFFELGNFLTDVSQFRDPFAFFCAKSAAWKAKKGNIFIMNIFMKMAGAHNYLDELLGTPQNPWGYLAQWFEQMMFAAVVEHFRKLGVAPEELQEIFFPRQGSQKYFTQYFPHEHLDFPPWPFGDAYGDRTKSTIARHICQGSASHGGSQPRKLLKYLEEQIVFISELLTGIEKDWSGLVRDRNAGRNTAPDPKQLHKILIQFGHACHVVEDFYFHSNFIDLAWLNLLRGKRSEPGEADFWVWFHENGFPDYRQRRVFFRRLRAPLAGQKKNELSRTDSELSKEVLTGGFGDKDVFHTFYDLLEGLPQEFTNIIQLCRQYSKPFWLLEYITIESKRRELVSGGDKKCNEVLKKHRQQLDQGEIEAVVTAAANPAVNKLHPLSAAAIKKACELDKKLGDRYPSPAGVAKSGVGGFLIVLSSMMQKEHDASEQVSAGLDKNRKVFDIPTSNGASAETIGSHSLLAKDSLRKKPLHDEALSTARFVSAYIVKLMLHQVYQNPDKKVLDWQHILHHFICHPDEAQNAWYKRAILAEAARNECQKKYLDPQVERDKAELTSRLKQEMRIMLELAYFRIEQQAEDQWQKDKALV
jgi:hypothetical protein